jgi:hypothetical protein
MALRSLLYSAAVALFLASWTPASAALPAVQIDNLEPYDESIVAWPGDQANPNNDTAKGLAVSLRVSPGLAVAPVMPFGACYFIDSRPAVNGSSDDVIVPFATAEQWEGFLKSHPGTLTLTPCCRRTEAANPCGAGTTPKNLPADRIGAIRVLSYSSSYADVYQCAQTESGQAVWKNVGGMAWGGCYAAGAANPQ